jgi:hypothetical protein
MLALLKREWELPRFQTFLPLITASGFPFCPSDVCGWSVKDFVGSARSKKIRCIWFLINLFIY